MPLDITAIVTLIGGIVVGALTAFLAPYFSESIKTSRAKKQMQASFYREMVFIYHKLKWGAQWARARLDGEEEETKRGEGGETKRQVCAYLKYLKQKNCRNLFNYVAREKSDLEVFYQLDDSSTIYNFYDVISRPFYFWPSQPDTWTCDVLEAQLRWLQEGVYRADQIFLVSQLNEKLLWEVSKNSEFTRAVDILLRRRAVEQLSTEEGKATAKGLIVALKDEYYDVRAQAVRALQDPEKDFRVQRDPEFVKALIAGLNDTNYLVRWTMVNALATITNAKMQDEVKQALVRVSYDTDETELVRGEAAKALRDF